VILLRVALALALGVGMPIGSPGASAAAAAPNAFRVIVNPANPVTELRRAEVRDLFLKRRSHWTSSLPVAPVDLSPTMDVRSEFSREILELSTTAVTTYWMQEIFAGRAEPPRVMSTVSAVLAFVAANAGAIAYIPADTPMDGVRAVRIVP
jgi:ABC-type phosphate transport system substrate-binding protein